MSDRKFDKFGTFEDDKGRLTSLIKKAAARGKSTVDSEKLAKLLQEGRAEREPLITFETLADRVGELAFLGFMEAMEIPINDPTISSSFASLRPYLVASVKENIRDVFGEVNDIPLPADVSPKDFENVRQALKRDTYYWFKREAEVLHELSGIPKSGITLEEALLRFRHIHLEMAFRHFKL